MRSLTATAAAGITPSVEAGRATVDAVWDPDLVADHAGVVGVDGVRRVCRTSSSASPGPRCSPRSPTRPPPTAPRRRGHARPRPPRPRDRPDRRPARDDQPSSRSPPPPTSVDDTDMGRVVTVEVDVESEGRTAGHAASSGSPCAAVPVTPSSSTRLAPVARSRIRSDTPRRSRASASAERTRRPARPSPRSPATTTRSTPASPPPGWPGWASRSCTACGSPPPPSACSPSRPAAGSPAGPAAS